ncbi:hypothetical protein Leryth_003373 [Lithospermum erythrorhizon]|nr:hypothetical protein Leryth_003373 [Lithospermum erythrorhizon]
MDECESIPAQPSIGIVPSVGSKDGATSAPNNPEVPASTASSVSDDNALAAISNNNNIDAYPPQEGPTPMEHNTSSSANAPVGGSEAANYHASVGGQNNGEINDGVSAGLSENGISTASVHEVAGFQDSVLSAEEERLWSIVHANSLDFNAWTVLIEETEKMSEGNISKIQKVYDSFLAEFPLCYGYWKKYADHEARLGSIEKVVEVYERAVVGVTYSVDMWLHYCAFVISTYGGDPDTVRRCINIQYAAEKISSSKAIWPLSYLPFWTCMIVGGRLFERGLAYVGSDYLSFPLWDKYIEYEYMQQDWPRVAMLYTRVLENPNQQLDRYFEGFKELVASRHLSELRTAEEIEDAPAANSEASGQENGKNNPNNAEDSSKPVNASLKDAEELEKYIAVREELYKKAKDFDSKIVGFEMAIKRPYFHVRPLVLAELENWHNYLDFIEGVGDFNKLSNMCFTVCYLAKHGRSIFLKEVPSNSIRGASLFHQRSISYAVVKLYERCLIACANYPDYWIRYVLCMEANGSMDLADIALARATQVFVKRQPEIHLFAARFREQHGNIPLAQAAYQLVHTEISPGLLEAIIKHANMEHRLGNLEHACTLYEQALAIEKGKEHSQALPLLYAQYSRFLLLVTGKVEKAREVLQQAADNIPLSKPLLEAFIHLESIQPLPKHIDYLDSLVEKFIAPSPDNQSVASVAEREELSSIFLEFLDLFGDAQAIKKADERHAKLFLRHQSSLESKKRHSEDYLVSDKTKLVKSVIPSSTPPVIGSYPSAQNQFTAGYGVQPQAWPQVAQPQAQQYTGYGQQAAYGAYGGYGTNYTQPQVPASVPQSAAYGAYPTTYPTQAAVQPSYAPPAAAPVAAAALPPAQQPAVVATAAYYNTSYY